MTETRDQQKANKRAAQRIFDVWNGDDEGAIDDVMAEDVVLHGHPLEVRGTAHGRETYKDGLRMVRSGFPDQFFEANEVVAEDDVVMAHCTWGGTHEGDFLGIEPTGASVEVADFVSYRFDDGELIEVISLPDLFATCLQLGVIEPPGDGHRRSTREAENEEIVRKYVEDVVTEGDLDVIDEIVAEDYVQYPSAASDPVHGRDEVKENVSALRTAFPDVECRVEDLIVDGDVVVRRDRTTGTHEGEFRGIEPTGEEIVVQGIHVHRIEDGQIVETWSLADELGVMRQLGVLEPPGE